jgi:predicted oxidoreductase
MNTQNLGKSSLVSTRLAYGCMRIAGTWDRNALTPELVAAGERAVHTAVECGYTHFDHADIYGNGMCEEIFGRVLAASPALRGGMLIASKCGIRWQGDGGADAPHRYEFSSAHIVWSCEQSLKRLGIETLDLYMLHRPDYLADPQEIASAFAQLQQQGKVRAFGVSNFRPSFLSMIQGACPMPLLVNQVEIHLGRLAAFEDGTLDQCIEQGITPVAWSPLGGGMLGDGGHVRDDDPRASTLRALLGVMDAMAQRLGCSRTVLALAWLLKHPARIIPVVGTANPDRIRDAARADALELSREDWYTLLTAARGQGLP